MDNQYARKQFEEEQSHNIKSIYDKMKKENVFGGSNNDNSNLKLNGRKRKDILIRPGYQYYIPPNRR